MKTKTKKETELKLNIGYELETGLDIFKIPRRISVESDGTRYFDDSFGRHLVPKGWKEPNPQMFDTFGVNHDGSIRTNKSNVNARELNSRVYKLHNKKDKEELFDGFARIAKGIGEVNNSMGLHFHVSFEDAEPYWILSSYEFADSFVKAYLKHFKSKEEQSRASNRYCKQYKSFRTFLKNVDSSLRSGSGDRYHAVNYCAYHEHKTIEFRLFPSTDSLLKFKRYVNFLHGFITEFVKTHPIKSRAYKVNDKLNEYTQEFKEKVEINKDLRLIEFKEIIKKNEEKQIDMSEMKYEPVRVVNTTEQIVLPERIDELAMMSEHEDEGGYTDVWNNELV